MPEQHRVKQGDCISSIAFARGFFPDTIWNHPGNAGLKARRQDPNVLLEGDLVAIPDIRVKEVSKPPEQRHRFRRKGVPEILRFKFLRDDQPIADEPYTIDIDGKISTGRTTAQGMVEHSIAPDAKLARILFNDGAVEHKFDLGYLDPVEEVRGAQGRLKNLGFYEGPLDGQITDPTTEAIFAFQTAHDLAATGELNRETTAALKHAYGG